MSSHRSSLRLRLEPIQEQPTQLHVAPVPSPSFSDLTSTESMDSHTKLSRDESRQRLPRHNTSTLHHENIFRHASGTSNRKYEHCHHQIPFHHRRPHSAIPKQPLETFAQHRRETHATAAETNAAPQHIYNPNRTKLLHGSHRLPSSFGPQPEPMRLHCIFMSREEHRAIRRQKRSRSQKQPCYINTNQLQFEQSTQSRRARVPRLDLPVGQQEKRELATYKLSSSHMHLKVIPLGDSFVQ